MGCRATLSRIVRTADHDRISTRSGRRTVGHNATITAITPISANASIPPLVVPYGATQGPRLCHGARKLRTCERRWGMHPAAEPRNPPASVRDEPAKNRGNHGEQRQRSVDVAQGEDRCGHHVDKQARCGQHRRR